MDEPLATVAPVVPTVAPRTPPVAPAAPEPKELAMDSTAVLPGASVAHVFGNSGNAGAYGAAGAGMGLGGLALGGIGGLVLGAMMGGNGGLFGSNRNGNGDSAVALGYGELVESIGDAKLAAVVAAGENRAATLEQTSMLQTAVATSNFNTLNTVNGLGRDLATASTQALIQNLNSFNVLSSGVQTGFNTSNILTQNGFNSAAMQVAEAASDIKAGQATITARAEAIAAAAALSLQECCCEMQKQSLENTQKILDQNANFRLQDLQIENSNLRQTAVMRDNNDAQTRVILSHLIPSAATVRTA